MADDATPAGSDESESTSDVDAAVEEHDSAEPDAAADDTVSDGADDDGSGDAPDEADTSDEAGAEDVADSDGESDADDVDADESEADDVDAASAKPRISHVRRAIIVGLVFVLALAGLTGWLGYGAYKSYQSDEQRNLFLQVGRQGALNLTTIDWEHSDADVQRVLDSATGSFYDDFQQRSQPFIAVVKQAKSKSVGTVTEAGLESESGDEAKVLVAVTVQTSNAGAPDQQPRAWRMRITVKKDGDDAKVSNVEFVP